jgi:hypothetical protein
MEHGTETVEEQTFMAFTFPFHFFFFLYYVTLAVTLCSPTLEFLLPIFISMAFCSELLCLTYPFSLVSTVAQVHKRKFSQRKAQFQFAEVILQDEDN